MPVLLGPEGEPQRMGQRPALAGLSPSPSSVLRDASSSSGAARIFPTCRGPVALGAKRTTAIITATCGFGVLAGQASFV